MSSRILKGVGDIRIIGVSELTAYLKARLDGDPFLANVWVRGEICNCHYHSSGHIYFSLRERDALIRGVMFRSRAVRNRTRLENGMAVVTRGAVDLYAREGTYQLYVEEVEPEGIGAYYAALEELKTRLQERGFFDEARKRPLPMMPRCVGLVTSPVGAAIKDVLTVAAKRWPLAAIVHFPVSVQGDTAPVEIARGIEALNAAGDVELIIVGRGGGAPEELWAFNSETVARAIFGSRVPVVSAVGHEKDVTIADLVADKRAATPSAAAELVFPDQSAVGLYLQGLEHRLGQAIGGRLSRLGSQVAQLQRSRALSSPVEVICSRRNRAVDLSVFRLQTAVKALLHRGNADLSRVVGRLDALSPLRTLARGYSICRRREDGSIVRSASDVGIGTGVDVQVHSGCLHCTVSGVSGVKATG